MSGNIKTIKNACDSVLNQAPASAWEGQTALAATAASLLALGFSGGANAATFTVTNLNDAGAGSLRQALLDANGAAGADTIDFQAGLNGTITLTTGQLAATDDVTITGPGAATLAVSGNNASRVLQINGFSTDVTISGLSLTAGNAAGKGGCLNSPSAGSLTLSNVSISNCVATGDGGGINLDDPNYAVTIDNSTISGNTSGGQGGGVHLYGNDAPIVIQNSTISGNSSASDGGGIYLYDTDGSGITLINTTVSGNTAGGNGGGINFSYADQLIVIQNSTISGNSASGIAGGVYFRGSSIHVMAITNSIIANNTSDLFTHAGDSFTIDYSLIENPATAAITDNGGNIFNTDPQLGLLANNGGPTQTHLPASSSPVVDAGDPAFTPPPATDQRGLARVSNGRIDMGSVETVIVASIDHKPALLGLAAMLAFIGWRTQRRVN
ncbi:MAG: choice-of-anchor Q domain-containing protein [Gammaproteobacteria bacterium]